MGNVGRYASIPHHPNPELIDQRIAGRTAVNIGVGVAIGIGVGLLIHKTQIDRFQKPTPIPKATPTPNFFCDSFWNFPTKGHTAIGRGFSWN
jgi:hypothetical protein